MYYIHIERVQSAVPHPANEDVRGVSWRYCEYDPQLSWNRPRLGSVQIGSAGSLSSCVATIGTICNLRFISSPQISVKDTFLDKGFFPNSIFHVIFILQVEIKYLVHLEKARGATEADEPI